MQTPTLEQTQKQRVEQTQARKPASARVRTPARGSGNFSSPLASGNIGKVKKHDPKILARLGNLRVRLAGSQEDIQAAQKLRHDVFYQEMGAISGTDNPELDSDPYDLLCDHLIVEDLGSEGKNRIIATCRLLLQSRLKDNGQGFYSQNEFDIAPLVKRKADHTFLELGRSCVRPQYRDKRTVELLWAAIWNYVCRHNVDVMFGCASFPGTIPAAHAEALSFLYHYKRAEDDWQVDAVRPNAWEMDLMPREGINIKNALHALPPLIKGYIRLGAMIGNHASVDTQFLTTDVLIILPVEKLNPRYVHYYGESATRHSAG